MDTIGMLGGLLGNRGQTGGLGRRVIQHVLVQQQQQQEQQQRAGEQAWQQAQRVQLQPARGDALAGSNLTACFAISTADGSNKQRRFLHSVADTTIITITTTGTMTSS